jgi:hypothetical protein
VSLRPASRRVSVAGLRLAVVVLIGRERSRPASIARRSLAYKPSGSGCKAAAPRIVKRSRAHSGQR